MPKPKPANTGSEDRARRMYVGSRRYTERMRSRSIAEYDQRWRQKHSESKKPYAESSYPDMEYHFDPWNPVFPPNTPPNMPWTPDNPSTPPVDGPPTVSGPPGKVPIIPPFLGCDFWSQTFSPYKIMPGEMAYSKFYLGPEETGIREVEVTGPVDLLGLEMLKAATGPSEQKKLGDPWIVVRAWDQGKIANDPHYKNVTGDIYYQIQVRTNSYFAPPELTAPPGQIARSNPWASGKAGVCSCKGYVRQCPPEIPLEYDWENSAQTVTSGNFAGVYVTGGLPPFTWSISGSGFFFPQKYTGRSALVGHDLGACGSATLTIVDACGEVVTGSVRSTTGQWYPVAGDEGHGCTLFGAYAEFTGNFGNQCQWEAIRGKYKQYEQTQVTQGLSTPCETQIGCGYSTESADNCDEICTYYLYCDHTYGYDCSDCLFPVGSPSIVYLPEIWVNNRCDIWPPAACPTVNYRECYCIQTLSVYEWIC